MWRSGSWSINSDPDILIQQAQSVKFRNQNRACGIGKIQHSPMDRNPLTNEMVPQTSDGHE
jgi:hypothetical protein